MQPREASRGRRRRRAGRLHRDFKTTNRHFGEAGTPRTDAQTPNQIRDQRPHRGHASSVQADEPLFFFCKCAFTSSPSIFTIQQVAGRRLKLQNMYFQLFLTVLEAVSSQDRTGNPFPPKKKKEKWTRNILKRSLCNHR